MVIEEEIEEEQGENDEVEEVSQGKHGIKEKDTGGKLNYVAENVLENTAEQNKDDGEDTPDFFDMHHNKEEEENDAIVTRQITIETIELGDNPFHELRELRWKNSKRYIEMINVITQDPSV